MSKTLSPTPAHESEPGRRRGAPEDPSETPSSEEYPARLARTRRGVGAARQRGSSNLGQPVGVLSWERDLLLGLAVAVLDDFVGSTNGQDD